MNMIKQNFTIEKEQMKQLREYCKETGMKMSTVVRMGLVLYFKQNYWNRKYAAKQNQNL